MRSRRSLPALGWRAPSEGVVNGARTTTGRLGRWRMPRRILIALIALAAPLMLLGGLSRLQPAAAAVTTAASQCAPLDANTANCSLTLDGSLVAGETVTVAVSGGSLDQASYAGGCQAAAAITPPALASSASFTFTAPDGGCEGPHTFSETV